MLQSNDDDDDDDDSSSASDAVEEARKQQCLGRVFVGCMLLLGLQGTCKFSASLHRVNGVL